MKLPGEWRPDVRDVLVLGGLGLVVSGVAMIYLPASLIVSGVALLWIGRAF